MRTKRVQPQHKTIVPTGQKNPLKEQPKPEEALQSVCGELEKVAVAEAGDEEAASELLGDDGWLGEHIDEVLASFEIDDGVRSNLVMKLRRKYEADDNEG